MSLEEFKEALGADVTIPMETVEKAAFAIYKLRQRVVQLEDLLKESRKLLWHNGSHDPAQCPSCALEQKINDALHPLEEIVDDEEGPVARDFPIRRPWRRRWFP